MLLFSSFLRKWVHGDACGLLMQSRGNSCNAPSSKQYRGKSKPGVGLGERRQFFLKTGITIWFTFGKNGNKRERKEESSQNSLCLAHTAIFLPPLIMLPPHLSKWWQVKYCDSGYKKLIRHWVLHLLDLITCNNSPPTSFQPISHSSLCLVQVKTVQFMNLKLSL